MKKLKTFMKQIGLRKVAQSTRKKVSVILFALTLLFWLTTISIKGIKGEQHNPAKQVEYYGNLKHAEETVEESKKVLKLYFS